MYDPTNYQNALLRYYQLAAASHSIAENARQSHRPFNLALQMAQFVKNMPARYRAVFSQWRNVTSLNTFGNTSSWISGINSGLLPNINAGLPAGHNPTAPVQPGRTLGHERLGIVAREVPIRVRRTRGWRKHERDGHHWLDPWQRRQCPDSDRKP